MTQGAQLWAKTVGVTWCVCTKCRPLPFDLTAISTLNGDEAFRWQQNLLLLLQLEWKEISFHCVTGMKELAL